MDIKQKFTDKITPEFKELIEELINCIESANKNLQHDIKWGRLTFAVNGDYHYWICGIAITKRSVNLIFHFGGLLDDKNNLFISGSSQYLRKLEFKNRKDIDEKVVVDFIKQAVNKLDYFKTSWNKNIS